MGRLKLVVLFLVFLTTAMAETFYVAADGDDGSDGSKAAPWRTIGRAVAGEEVRGGGEVVVAAGRYEGPLEIRGEFGGSLRIRGLIGARIDVTTADDAVEIGASGGVIFEGFEIHTAGGTAVRVSGLARGCVLRALKIFSDGCGDGIVVERAAHVLIERNAIRGARNGIVLGGVGAVIRSNVVSESSVAGVVLGRDRRAVSTLVQNNTLLENGSSSSMGGALWIIDAVGVRVENNIMVAGAGRRLFTADVGDVRFSHNLYFSPNEMFGAEFSWEGTSHFGFASLRLVTGDRNAIFENPMVNDFGVAPSSSAIDGGGVGERALALDILGKPRRAGVGVDVGAHEFSHPGGLRVSGNQIVHQNRVVRLRGVGVGDPVLDRRERPFADYRILRERWNANTVRLSVHPLIWRDAEDFGGREEVLRWFREEINAALRAGHYVILDWHITGWPDGFARPSEHGEREGLHDSSFELAKDFWDAAAREFGGDGRIAFELWNEPVRGPDDWKPNPADWIELRPYLEELTEIVRRHSQNMVIVSGGNWAYCLAGIRDNPPSDANTAIAWHVYAGKELNDEKRWAVAFDEIHRDFPVIVTEWGFAETGQPHYRGNFKDFGEKFARRWLIGRDLHWVAWCWHPTVGPPLLESDWKTPTAFGSVVGKMLRANPPKEHIPPASISPNGQPVVGYSPLTIN